MPVIVWEFASDSEFLPLELTAEGVVGTVGTLDIELFAVTLDATGVRGNTGTAVFSLPVVESTGTGVTGVVGTLNLNFPKPTITGTSRRDGYATLTLPELEIGATGHATRTWSFAIEATLPTLEAYGFTESDLTDTDYEVWVVNSETKFHSTYTNWNVNSFGIFNGTQIVCKDDGLYEATGTDDEGTSIPCQAIWGNCEFSSFQQKRIPEIFTNLRGGTRFNIVLWADESEKRIVLPFEVSNIEGIHRVRIKPPLGVRGQTWKVGFENAYGDDFHLTELELNIAESKRRIR